MITIEQIKDMSREDVERLEDKTAFDEAFNIKALREARKVVSNLESQILPLASAFSRRAESVGLNPTSRWDDMEDEDGNEPDPETQEIRANLHDRLEGLADLSGVVYGNLEYYDDMEHEFWTPSTC